MARVAGQAVTGGQGGVETVLGAREVWQVAWGRGFSFEFTVTRTRLPEVRLGVFLLPGTLGETEARGGIPNWGFR